MSNILKMVQDTIANSIRVEVKSPINKNGKQRYPVIVTDMSPSFTSGWFVQYNPVAMDNGTRLYDGSESFSELNIARFSELQNFLLTAAYYFSQGSNVETLTNGRQRAIYDPDPRFRLTVTSSNNSISVVLTITDNASPFHMLSIAFRIVPSNTGDGSYYIIGADKCWDRNTDTFREVKNANFAPSKSRFYRVFQNQNQPATIKAKLAVNNNQYMINSDGTFAIDTQAAAPEYIQVISSEYKALAYIYEQALMKKSFEIALQQGLPSSKAMNANIPNNELGPNGTFTPSFTLGGIGAPNPVQNQTNVNPNNTQLPPVPPMNMAGGQQQQQQMSQQDNSFNIPKVNGVDIQNDDLPWT
ncbi:hypothetical protein NST86_33595 [Bacillus sp. FSL L8-0199]|uniref:hypothetical protein n=1 Tax=Bacillus sp. FSL L8-0199 TaxID=2954616 RepID=UPI0030F5C698